LNVYVRTIAVAVILGAVAFFATIGLVTVLFNVQTDAFVPKNSADVASWMQAIGSVIAILASYHLGARQAAEAKRQEAERQATQKARQTSIGTLVQSVSDRALKSIGLLLIPQGDPILAILTPGEGRVIEESLRALRAIPMQEIDPPKNVEHVAGIISSLTHVQTFIQQIDVALEPFK